MVKDSDIKKFREELMNSTRPIFLFDDDPDGLASFLILYRLIKTGTGKPTKGSIITENMADLVNNYQPDLVVILDKSDIEEEFLEKVNTKIIWIDHHKPTNKKVHLYINPMIENSEDNTATSYWAYKIAKQDEWLCAVGMVSDWQVPSKEIITKLKKQYPKFITHKTPEQCLFEDEVGKLAKIFSFNLKGRIKDILASVRMLSRVEDPYDLLEGKNSQTKLLLKQYEKHNSVYQELLNSIEINDETLIVHKYISSDNAYTTDLSNELLYKHPEKIIIVARESNGSYKCSLRSASYDISTILEKTLKNIEGTGGGQKHACGAVIPTENFDDFIAEFKSNLE